MPQELEVHRVFLASPSDVPVERAAALDVVGALNASVSERRGKLIYLTGWEYLPPGAGRPQDIINRLVDQCDIFVGLLHERWGTPTGMWSSGFEEEFRRTETRHQDTGSPAMAMFFKSPSAEVAASPTEDYQQIRRFRESISQAHMYAPFHDAQEWRYVLTRFLVDAVELAEPAGLTPADLDTRRELRAAVSMLAEREQTVLGLYYFEDLDFHEIGSILGITPGQAHDTHLTAVLQLRSRLPIEVLKRLGLTAEPEIDQD